MSKTLDEKFAGTWSTMDMQDLTKFADRFAELIVKECASLCEINGSTYKYSFTPAKAMLAESASKYCGTMIKKHFGVEE
jgi:hypothetical protein